MAASPATRSFLSTNQLRKAIVYLSLWAGVLLTALLPIGMFDGVKGAYFYGLFWVHLGILVLAALFSLVLYVRCARRAAIGSVLTIGALLLFVAVLVLESLHPITSRDALIHHLAVPRWWVEAGRIVQIPWHEWSHYPMLLNLGFTGFIVQGWAQYSSLYHALYLIVACGVVCGFVLYKSQDYNAATVSFLLLFTIPVCTRLASTPLVDLGLCLFSVICFVHLIYWAEGKHRLLHLLIAGVALGLALSCKYNGLLMAVVLFLSLPFLTRTSGLGFGALFKASLFVGLCALLVFSPWLVKNVAWTNNPLYPLFNSYFSVSAGPRGPKPISPITQRMVLYGENPLDVVLIPVKMLLVGEDGNPRRFDGVLTPLLLLSLVPLYWVVRQPWILFSWLALGLYLILALVMNSARVRYLAPMFGPAVILSAVGLWRLSLLSNARHKRRVLLAGVALMLGWSGWHAGKMLSESEAVAYAEGTMNSETYLSRHIAEYPAIQFVNANIPDDSIVYLLNTGNRFYYFDKHVTSSGHFSASQILAWIRSSSSPEFLLTEFKNRNIRFLMANTELSRRTFQDSLTIEERSLWNDFQQDHLRLLFNQRGFSVWKIE